jgi:hypothetical protein
VYGGAQTAGHPSRPCWHQTTQGAHLGGQGNEQRAYLIL